MNTNLSDITVILDRSGSMMYCRDEAIKGINLFVNEQKATPGDCTFTLIQFDTEFEVVHNGVNIADIPPIDLVPRDGTALLDAVGEGIVKTGERLAEMNEDDRPGLVIFTIVTDGEENSSSKYSRSSIKSMIKHQQDKYNWKFVFLGANQNAFLEAGLIGIPPTSTADYAVNSTQRAFSSLSGSISRSRQQYRENMKEDLNFTADERASMK